MVKIRLSRVGSKKRPVYKVVAADSRRARDGRFIEQLGTYDPCATPPYLKLNKARVDHWLSVGAQPTDTARRVIRGYVAPADAAPSA